MDKKEDKKRPSKILIDTGIAFRDGLLKGIKHIEEGGKFEGFTDEVWSMMKRSSSLLTLGYDEEE